MVLVDGPALGATEVGLSGPACAGLVVPSPAMAIPQRPRAVVTGGAGGLGRALCLALAERGALAAGFISHTILDYKKLGQ